MEAVGQVAIEQSSSVTWELKKKLAFLLSRHRYKVLHGGRGAGPKSWTIARTLLYKATQEKLLILCAREFMNSIADSVHRLLKNQAEMLNLSHLFDFQRDVIRCSVTGSEFIFIGLHNNTSKIKSMEGADIVWIEEAESVSWESWKDLDPTIRKPGSEIWLTLNPQDPKDYICQLFLGDITPEGHRQKPLPPDSKVVKVTTEDNENFPDTLRTQRDHDYKTDPDLAAHKWGGDYRKNSDAQILRNKYIVDTFEPKREWFGPYYGADHGFAKDPATVVKCWLSVEEVQGDIRNELPKIVKLYVEEEAYQIGCELKNLPSLFNSINGTRQFHPRTGVLLPNQPVIRCDKSRPETISFLRGFGFNTVSAKQGPSSVEEGVIWLRNLDQIVIHPRCVHTIEEARLYSFKKDRNTGEVFTIIVDKFNHMIDAIRYAMEPYIITDAELEAVYEEPVCISADLDMIDGMGGLGDW
jgi:phage terminase large subunit